MGLMKYTGGANKNTMIPFYVTRADGDGVIYKWNVGMSFALWLIVIGQITIMLWLLIALVTGLLVAGHAIADLVGSVV